MVKLIRYVMKTLKFKSFKAAWILEGTKTSSMRLFDDKDLSPGDELELVNSDTGTVFAYANVTEVVMKPLRELNDVDFEGHERWNSEAEMYESLRRYYGDRVNGDTEVKVVRFALTETE